jgi:pantothenate kinase (EC 2.7.1.33)
MLLAIDAGNTNVVFAVWDGAAWRGRWRIATVPDRTADEYAVWLLQLMTWEGFARPTSTPQRSPVWCRTRSTISAGSAVADSASRRW